MDGLIAEWGDKGKKIGEVEDKTIEITQFEWQNESSLKLLIEAHTPVGL